MESRQPWHFIYVAVWNALAYFSYLYEVDYYLLATNKSIMALWKYGIRKHAF